MDARGQRTGCLHAWRASGRRGRRRSWRTTCKLPCRHPRCGSTSTMNDHRVETETDVLRSRELLDAVLEYAPGFILAIDEHGTLVYINRILPQYDRKKVIGNHW